LGRSAGRLVSAGRRLLAVADALPVTVLAAIAGAGSFTHIRDTAAQHGQGGPMSWAVAVCIDLTCVMAARERQRDKQAGITARRLSWPTVVLAGGVLLSLAANLAQVLEACLRAGSVSNGPGSSVTGGRRTARNISVHDHLPWLVWMLER
jgi:hypothetical protein